MTFSEHQHVPRIVLWVLLGIGACNTAFLLATGLLLELDQGQSITLDGLLVPAIAVLAVVGAMLLLFWRSVLHVGISDEGVQIRFTPFHRTPRIFAWSDIERVIVRNVNAFGEFGGWGIRWNFSKTVGYVWRGKTGIDLRLRNGQRVVATIEDIASAIAVIRDVVPAGVECEIRISESNG